MSEALSFGQVWAEFRADGAVVHHDTRTLEQAQAQRIAAIKAEAAERIAAIAPAYRQANLTARAAELALRLGAGGKLSADEQAEIAAGTAVWERIKAIRAASNEAEARVLAAKTNDEADAVTW